MIESDECDKEMKKLKQTLDNWKPVKNKKRKNKKTYYQKQKEKKQNEIFKAQKEHEEWKRLQNRSQPIDAIEELLKAVEILSDKMIEIEKSIPDLSEKVGYPSSETHNIDNAKNIIENYREKQKEKETQ